ncbi:hypothetical protein OQJ05_15215 [Fluoribacter gormanii]|uniref:hypothetical protein n=1 Tax=Fluoribacter gormanii TaxID=464 RepID=UPI0022448696|nr:hypothetical protein [Fluoribacter gormanii]MCW8445395.1 hypothetical protein [Fluoribacter gormanii]
MTQLAKSSKAINKLYIEILAHESKTICFTSPLFTEGITTIASAVAKAATAFGRKVLYCDFGNYNTSLSKQLNLEFKATQGSILEQAFDNIKYSDKDGFYIMPLPGPRPFELSLIEKEMLNDFFNKLKEQFDLIIIDCHCFNKYQPHTISTRYLSEAANATVLIVLSGVTTKEAVEETVEEMKKIGTHLIGCVMNDFKYPRLIDELYKETSRLDRYVPKFAEYLRQKMRNSVILNMEI